MKQTLFTSLLFLLVISMSAQNYIGNHKLEIRKKINAEFKDFHFTKEVNSSSHHFLKFEEVNGDKTLLCVLDENEYCYYCMLMCDYSYLRTTIDSLNLNHKSLGNMMWLDTKSGKNGYVIKLKKEEWYFTLITKKQN